MKLKTIRVQNYKCIDDSTEFSIDTLTCLAGKNEAGKTAVLQALRRLNPVESSESEYDSLMEYPRKRHYEFQASGLERTVLTTKWSLSPDDINAVNLLIGRKALREAPEEVPQVVITRGYDNESMWSLALDEAEIIDHMVSETTELTEQAKREISKDETIGELHTRLHSKGELTTGETELLNSIETRFPDNDPEKAVAELLKNRLPHFLYFPTYNTLPGRISVEELAGKVHNVSNQTEGDRLFLALMELAGTDVQELQNAREYEHLKARLESVSNHLSDQIFEYWSQNRDLAVEFSYDEGKPGDTAPFDRGHVFNLRVRNNRHRVTVSFDQRSAGFVWFFSFLVWFSSMERRHGDNLVILLDEPGLSLHGKAQADLLRYIKERLLPQYQVIYTTHSPFMIDFENILSVRTVQDVITQDGKLLGTKVGDRPLRADADTLFPLRAALGYDITQSLFIGENSLLVEGPSDLLYLHWFTRQLVARKRIGLDTRWTITPVGGIDKLGSFVSLFAGNHLNVAILTDFHSGDKNKVRNLKESGLLEASNIFTADRFAGQPEADIEDVIGWELYSSLVNMCYDLPHPVQLPVERDEDGSPLILDVVKQHFVTVAIEGPDFDHLSPAVFLVKKEDLFRDAPGLDLALARFERFFKTVNELLPPI